MKNFRDWLTEDKKFAIATQHADAKQRRKDAKDAKDPYAEKFYDRKAEILGKLKVGQSRLHEARSASSVGENLLGHMTHAKELHHTAPEHSDLAVQHLEGLHALRQGKPSETYASLKHDGGASVHIIHDENGIAVSDKHRMARGVVARTPEEIDQHFGHQPGYAAALKHLLTHGASVVNRGHHVQGDLLWTPHDTHQRQVGGTTTYTPNRITYKGKTKAKVGIAIHTEVTDGVAHAVSDKATRSSKSVFVPEHKYQPNPKTYSAEDKAGFEHHIGRAKELLAEHTTKHLTPDHISQFTIYANRAGRRNENPTIEGYIRHLQGEGEKAAGNMKSPAGAQKKRDIFQQHIEHVKNNREHFQRTIDIRHHLEQATEHVLNGVSHPDLHTSIDGKKSAGEGIVLGRKDKKGRVRPEIKAVPKLITYELFRNARFQRA